MKMLGDLIQWVRREEWIRDIFRIQEAHLPEWQQRILFVVRKLLSSWLRFRDSRSAIQVGALSYLTLISLVPVLAFSFSIVKTLGLHQQLQNDVIDPLLNQWIPAEQAPELRSGIEQMLLFVEHTDVASLRRDWIGDAWLCSHSNVECSRDCHERSMGCAPPKVFMRKLQIIYRYPF